MPEKSGGRLGSSWYGWTTIPTYAVDAGVIRWPPFVDPVRNWWVPLSVFCKTGWSPTFMCCVYYCVRVRDRPTIWAARRLPHQNGRLLQISLFPIPFPTALLPFPHPFSHGMLQFPVSKERSDRQKGVKTTHLPGKIPTPHQQINTREKRLSKGVWS